MELVRPVGTPVVKGRWGEFSKCPPGPQYSTMSSLQECDTPGEVWMLGDTGQAEKPTRPDHGLQVIKDNRHFHHTVEAAFAQTKNQNNSSMGEPTGGPNVIKSCRFFSSQSAEDLSNYDPNPKAIKKE